MYNASVMRHAANNRQPEAAPISLAVESTKVEQAASGVENLQSCLLDHWLILLLGHASEMAREGEVDSIYLGQHVHHFSRTNPGVQNETLWIGPMLLHDLLQPAKCAHTVHLQDHRSKHYLYGVLCELVFSKATEGCLKIDGLSEQSPSLPLVQQLGKCDGYLIEQMRQHTNEPPIMCMHMSACRVNRVLS